MEINKEEVEQRFRRSRVSYNDNARVQKMVVDRMVPMILSSVERVPEKILEIGCGTGLLTSQLQRTFPSDGLYLNDLVEVYDSGRNVQEIVQAIGAKGGVGVQYLWEI